MGAVRYREEEKPWTANVWFKGSIPKLGYTLGTPASWISLQQWLVRKDSTSPRTLKRLAAQVTVYSIWQREIKDFTMVSCQYRSLSSNSLTDMSVMLSWAGGTGKTCRTSCSFG
ncbi:hypothetical protein Bca4012_062026 [Brassica carinata]